jgi:anti-sigma B factor antagonist
VRPNSADRLGWCAVTKPDETGIGDEVTLETQVSQVPVGPGRPTVAVLGVRGEVDLYSAPALKHALTQLFEGGSSTVVVDLSDVSFLDSTGLGALVEARVTATEAGGSLPLVCDQERVLKLFTITGLDSVFTMHDTLELALASLAG